MTNKPWYEEAQPGEQVERATSGRGAEIKEEPPLIVLVVNGKVRTDNIEIEKKNILPNGVSIYTFWERANPFYADDSVYAVSKSELEFIRAKVAEDDKIEITYNPENTEFKLLPRHTKGTLEVNHATNI